MNVIIIIFWTEFDGIKTHSHLVFNKRQVRTEGLTSQDVEGPTVSLKITPKYTKSQWKLKHIIYQLCCYVELLFYFLI